MTAPELSSEQRSCIAKSPISSADLATLETALAVLRTHQESPVARAELAEILAYWKA